MWSYCSRINLGILIGMISYGLRILSVKIRLIWSIMGRGLWKREIAINGSSRDGLGVELG